MAGLSAVLCLCVRGVSGSSQYTVLCECQATSGELNNKEESVIAGRLEMALDTAWPRRLGRVWQRADAQEHSASSGLPLLDATLLSLSFSKMLITGWALTLRLETSLDYLMVI